jgi:tetratricopeptide (TPR) repeat protein
MEVEARDTTAESPARRLLIKQERLIDAQLTGERLSNGLKMLGGFAGLTATVALGLMAWTASRADGLVVDAFSVPPTLAEQGVTGEAVARQLIDELVAISDIAKSRQEQRGVSGGWAGALSIQIPATGISLAQLNQWLRETLGHQSHVGGEVMVGKDGGLTLRTRSSGRGLPPQTGPATDVAALIHRTAEEVYKREQPPIYGQYLARLGRSDEAIALAREMTTWPDPRDRASGFNVLGLELGTREGDQAGLDHFRKAIAADPTDATYVTNLAAVESRLGHAEAALRLRRRGVALSAKPGKGESPESWRLNVLVNRGNVAEMVGDWQGGLVRQGGLVTAEATKQKVMVGFGSTNSQGALAAARDLAAMHEATAAEAALGEYTPTSDGDRLNALNSEVRVARSNADWPRTLRSAEAVLVYQAKRADQGRLRPISGATRALALAHLGQIADAQILIGGSPLDCQSCVSIRGEIAALAGDARTADHWFGQAVRMAPSVPFANTTWGRVLFERGDTAAAVRRFAAANRQSPRFPDPIAYWGEALLEQGDPKGAVAKFTEADQYAPRWGRLHLKWGEALAKLGKAAEAQAQFKAAAGMDLTPSERSELAQRQAGR